MTSLTIKTTSRRDLTGLTRVVEETQLFPCDMLETLLSPALSGDAPDVWLTAYADDDIVGFAYTIPEEMADGTWTMRALAVLPARQGLGIGSELVASTEAALRDRGARLLIVDTSGTPDFALTRAFYAGNGYDEEARIRDFWADGYDKVTYRKAL